MLEKLKEFSIVVWGETWVWQTVLSHDMVPEEMLMEQAVPKVGVG